MSKQKKAKRGGGARALAMSFQRRDFLKLSGAAGVTAALPFSRWVAKARADGDMPGLSNPALQPRFTELVPNALDPGFIYDTKKGKIKVAVGQTTQMTGLVAPDGTTPVPTTVWGYGDKQFYTWPGRTFEVRSNEPLEVKWENRLIDGLGDPLPYIITGKDNTSIGFGDYTGRPVFDESLHWAYSLHGYEGFSIENDGVPIVAHVHGGHSDFAVDGNPEFFFSPGWEIRGPQWVDKKYLYDNRQPAGTVWYHDHALGITRLNVYAGMAGFYIIRDEDDTGLPGNPLSLPAFPYEAAFAIQDRMFKDNGEFFYPAFPGDPFYADFITEGPTALAEFFGDHMVVNGKIWPKMDVEPRNYRLRLLNGCDSRFLAVQFFEVPSDAEDFSQAIQQLPFTVIGSDQGLASSPTTVDTLLLETGSRYDLVFDFKSVAPGNRVIMKNIGGDEPFGGDIPGPQVFGETDRIMAFDVVLPIDSAVDDVSPSWNGCGSARLRSSRAWTSLGAFSPCWEPRSLQRTTLATRSTGRIPPTTSAPVWSVRWKDRSPGTIRRLRTLHSTRPRNGRSGTLPATLTRCTSTWSTSRSWAGRRSTGTATQPRTIGSSRTTCMARLLATVRTWSVSRWFSTTVCWAMASRS
jgi:FtsP/CotA-like multicopper oxidase with cupredoxin domain